MNKPLDDLLTIDINAFTIEDWNAIQSIAKELVLSKLFNKDPFKCSIAAFVLWIDQNSRGVCDELAPDGTLFN